MNPCRCGHAHDRHRTRPGVVPFCLHCLCPEYRAAETRETLALRGTEEL